MDFFYSWIRTIILFSILASIALELIPSNRYRSYVQLFVGFLTVFLVVEPFINAFGSKKNISLEAMGQMLFVDTSQIERENKNFQKNKVKLYENEVEQQVKSLLEGKNYKVYSQRVKFDSEEEIGKIESIKVTVKEEGNASDKKKSMDEQIKTVKKVIKDFYQLSDTYIDVTVRE